MNEFFGSRVNESSFEALVFESILTIKRKQKLIKEAFYRSEYSDFYINWTANREGTKKGRQKKLRQKSLSFKFVFNCSSVLLQLHHNYGRRSLSFSLLSTLIKD